MSIPMSLAGRHALVCGGSAGIGRAAALAIAALGGEVTVLARRRNELQALISELRVAGAKDAGFIAVDLDDRVALIREIDGLLATHSPVHVLVNNAAGPAAGPLLDASEEDLLRAFERHILASHLLVRRLLPGMRSAGYGRIVNVISTSVREPIPGLGVSNIVRGAMASWAKTLSRELPPGVTINNLLPGYTDTERLGELAKSVATRTGKTVDDVRAGWIGATPEGRLARPEEMGSVIAFLASPAAAFIRGQSLAVDGGRLASI
jgi:3-oxoacyl-[acyl-carrier protein] reductase